MVSSFAVVMVAAMAAPGQVVLLDFSATWCGPCKQMEPIIAQMQANGYPVQKVDIEEHKQLAKMFRITSVPTFVLLDGEEVVGRLEGAQSYESLAQMFGGYGRGGDNIARGRPSNPSSPGQSRANQAPTTSGVPDIDIPEVPIPESSSNGAIASFEQPVENSTARVPSTTARPPVANSLRQNAPLGRPGMDPYAEIQNPYVNGDPSDMSAAPVNTGRMVDYQSTSGGNMRSGNVRETSAAMNADDTVKRAHDATVKIRVEDPDGFSVGTGTIIDTQGEDALVVTCGHIFRDSRGRGRIEIEICGTTTSKKYDGEMLIFDADIRDIALISFKPGGPVSVAKVAPENYRPQQGDASFTVGCNHGEDATVLSSRILSINKFHGAPNIVSSGKPVEGRSGGGLFTKEGYLIGICNAAFDDEDAGIYAGLDTIHWQLSRFNLAHVFKRNENDLAIVPEDEIPSPETRPGHPVAEPNGSNQARLGDVHGGSFNNALPPTEMGHTSETLPTRLHGTSLSQALANPNLSRGQGGNSDTEVICIIKSGDQNRTVTIPYPSPQFLNQIYTELDRQSGNPVGAGGPDVLRGQSNSHGVSQINPQPDYTSESAGRSNGVPPRYAVPPRYRQNTNSNVSPSSVPDPSQQFGNPLRGDLRRYGSDSDPTDEPASLRVSEDFSNTISPGLKR